MSQENKRLRTLDSDLQQELQRKLERLKADYEEKKNNAIDDAFNIQKERESVRFLSETPPENSRPVRQCAVQAKPCGPNLSMSPILCAKSRSKKRRKFFPHISNKSLKLLTSAEAVQEFALPQNFVATLNENTFVCNTEQYEVERSIKVAVEEISPDPLLEHLKNKMETPKSNEAEFFHSLEISIAFLQSRTYVALIDDDAIVKVYLKFEKEKWKERWKVNTKTQNRVDDVRWMQGSDSSSLYLLVVQLEACSVGLFHLKPDEEIKHVYEFKIDDLSCVLVMPGSKLVICGEKMSSYSFDQQNRSFQKNISFMPACTVVTSLSLINEQDHALVGSSLTNYYIWNLATGSLLKQFDTQISGSLLSAFNVKGVLTIDVISRTSVGCVLLNPMNEKQFVISRKHDEYGGIVTLSLARSSSRVMIKYSEFLPFMESVSCKSKPKYLSLTEDVISFL